jgi:BirA family biotin operon repressor/biotin-[acetyl-CoA-carboxylase] ligase
MSGLDEAAILRAIARRGAALGLPLSVVKRTASTNDDARRAALAGAPHGAAFLADEQSAGRGRGGHRWHSPPGENLYLSVVLRPRLPAMAAAPITLACGVAVAHVVERALVAASAPTAAVQLKWPNDVLVDGRKIAGVLVEGQIRGEALQSLVVGVGLNVRARRFPEEIQGRATSLALLGAEPPREELAADLLAALGEGAARFEGDGLAALAGELARRDWLRGRRVTVGEIAGEAVGLDAEGRLLVRTDDGALCPVVAGEVSVVLDDARAQAEGPSDPRA